MAAYRVHTVLSGAEAREACSCVCERKKSMVALMVEICRSARSLALRVCACASWTCTAWRGRRTLASRLRRRHRRLSSPSPSGAISILPRFRGDFAASGRRWPLDDRTVATSIPQVTLDRVPERHFLSSFANERSRHEDYLESKFLSNLVDLDFSDFCYFYLILPPRVCVFKNIKTFKLKN